MEELNEIEQIIIRCLDQSASESDLSRLKDWLNESEENQKHYYEFKDVWDALPLEQAKEGAIDEWKRFTKSKLTVSPLRKIGIELAKFAAVALLALLAGHFFFSPEEEQIQYATITVPYGSKSSLKLPDGTNVILNAGSELTYPTSFAKASRDVALVGEAYFDVVHHSDHPFIVSVDELEVKVLGTQFNVLAYPEFDRIETTLVDGKVQLYRKGYESGDGVILKPGQKATFKDNRLKLQRANLDLETMWVNNEFYFENIPFHELMTRLEKWYDVSIIFDKERFKDLTYTGKFRNEETVWQAFDAIRMTTPVEYTTEHRKVFITLKK